jgi:hypothetical protein
LSAVESPPPQADRKIAKRAPAARTGSLHGRILCF